MKFSIPHKIVSIALTFLVVLSTVSFTVEKHYCGTNLIDVAIFSEVKNCSPNDAKETYTKKPCCKDTVDFFEGQDELKTTNLQDYNTTLELVLVAYVYSYSQLFESLSKPIIPHKDYSPPNLTKDIHVLDETYLI